MKDIRERILSELSQISTNYNVRILYACESGSRAWGFDNSDSDYDVRFVYASPLNCYLSIDSDHRKDTIEEDKENIIDIVGWDIKKALGLLRKSNPQLIEWLNSPIIYIEEDTAVTEMRNAIKYFSIPMAMFYHYLHIASSSYYAAKNISSSSTPISIETKHKIIKKYFYSLRSILTVEWTITNIGQIAPVPFIDLLNGLDVNQDLRTAINKLLTKTKSKNLKNIDKYLNVLDGFLATKLKYYRDNDDDVIARFPSRERGDVEILDKIFRNQILGDRNGR